MSDSVAGWTPSSPAAVFALERADPNHHYSDHEHRRHGDGTDLLVAPRTALSLLLLVP